MVVIVRKGVGGACHRYNLARSITKTVFFWGWLWCALRARDLLSGTVCFMYETYSCLKVVRRVAVSAASFVTVLSTVLLWVLPPSAGFAVSSSHDHDRKEVCDERDDGHGDGHGHPTVTTPGTTTPVTTTPVTTTPVISVTPITSVTTPSAKPFVLSSTFNDIVLPVTGASGNLLRSVLIAGAALVLVGFGVLVATRRTPLDRTSSAAKNTARR